MRTLLFPTHDVVPFELPSQIPSSYQNGLYVALANAYNNHHGIIIGPDDIYNTITHLWAKYVLINAENFRNQIVKHEGQKTLIIQVEENESWNASVLINHLNGFISEVHKDQGDGHTTWMQNKFSTSTIQDEMVRMCSVMSAMKQYYIYESHLLCWLPEITLLGEIQDWELLYSSIQEMKTYDDHMIAWKEKLLSVISYFIKGNIEDIDFWQQVMVPKTGGSGTVPSYQGWATVFNPFDEKGKWFNKPGLFGKSAISYYNTPRTAILSLSVDFEIICKDQGGNQTGKVCVVSEPTTIKESSGRIVLDSKLQIHYHKMMPLAVNSIDIEFSIPTHD